MSDKQNLIQFMKRIPRKVYLILIFFWFTFSISYIFNLDLLILLLTFIGLMGFLYSIFHLLKNHPVRSDYLGPNHDFAGLNFVLDNVRTIENQQKKKYRNHRRK